MSAGHRDSFIGCQNSGSGLFTSGNVVPQSGVKISQSTHSTDRSHTAVQFVFCKTADHIVGDSLCQAIAHDLFDQCFIVTLFLLGLSVACQMDMHVDQPRQNIFSL